MNLTFRLAISCSETRTARYLIISEGDSPRYSSTMPLHRRRIENEPASQLRSTVTARFLAYRSGRRTTIWCPL
jgi:hypothetical protein